MFDSLRQRLASVRHSKSLYFAGLLSEKTILAAFGKASDILDSAHIYTTAVTLWTFLSQVLSQNHSCEFAVTKLIGFRLAHGKKACSSQTGAYCIARDKLDEESMHRLVTHSGKEIEAATPREWRWLGHRVVAADGTTITMPDTPANQAEYPQQKAQKPGCGFPIIRCVVLFALASGTVLEMALGKYQGKQSAEINLLRQISDVVQKNDVFLGDRAYSGWFTVARLMQRGVAVVVRKCQSRKTNFRTGIHLGKDDHVVQWKKPQYRSAMGMTRAEYDAFPEFITIREIRIRVEQRGFRTREIIVATSLLDHQKYTHAELARLFLQRWQAELNLRSLKQVLQMDHLRCLEPHRVRNELRAHLLAYNLVRQVMCEAAIRGGNQPWHLSFKGTLTKLTELLPSIGAVANSDALCDVILDCCSEHEVGHRFGRYEPRRVKRRPKGYKLLQKPRRDYQPGEV